MKTTRTFESGIDRYLFDFNRCTTTDGWAQFDTQQDAPYYGCWINPFALHIVSFVEGDICVHECGSVTEFQDQVKMMIDWHNDNDKFLGIDPGFNAELRDRLSFVGLSEFAH